MARTGEGQGEWSLKLTPEEERVHRRRVDAASMTDETPATKEQIAWIKSRKIYASSTHHEAMSLIARIEQEQAISVSMARLTMADTEYMEELEATIERLQKDHKDAEFIEWYEARLATVEKDLKFYKEQAVRLAIDLAQMQTAGGVACKRVNGEWVPIVREG